MEGPGSLTVNFQFVQIWNNIHQEGEGCGEGGEECEEHQGDSAASPGSDMLSLAATLLNPGNGGGGGGPDRFTEVVILGPK